MNRGKILVIDDDPEMRDSLQTLLSNHGFETVLQKGADKVFETLQSQDLDAILCDVRMPGMSGLDLLDQLGPESNVPLVLMSAHGDIAMAVQAMHDGAFTFLEKPFEPRHLIKVLDRGVDYARLRRRESRLKERLGQLGSLDRILLGECEAIRQLRDQVLDVADSDVNVLVIGETGTGKELVARAIHDLGGRSTEPFVAINCALAGSGGFDETLFGDREQPQGLFRQADGGTLFLDEVDAIPLDVQPKLLRVLESGELVPLGATQAKKSDFRLISAAAERMEERAARQEFRSDLLFRLNTVTLELPPLRQRGEDMVLLHRHFLAHFADIYEIETPPVSVEDVSVVMGHTWPGNVRELRNLCERQVLLSRRGHASVAEVLAHGPDVEPMPETLREAVAAFERQIIGRALVDHCGRMDAVATKLGIGRRTLNEKIVKLGLDKNRILGPDGD